jgi:hypothetical protein
MLPAAPFPWSTATQAPRSAAVQAGTAAEETRTASEALTVPDEVVAKAAVVTISPARLAAAMTAVTRRAVVGKNFIMVVL